MSDGQTPHTLYKPMAWALVAVAGVALTACGKSGNADNTSAPNGTGVAYDTTTGNTVAANATANALGSGGPPPVQVPGANSANGSAGGTQASVNPQAAAAPGPVAGNAQVPAADLNSQK